MNLKSCFLKLIILLLFCLFSNHLWAQKQDTITPLHQFFQNNYDSTIIYHKWSNWYSAPDYLILAKQKEKVYFFTYSSPYKKARGINYPGGLMKKFAAEEQKFQSLTPDTNRYLLPKPIYFSVLNQHWQELTNSYDLWQLKDDQDLRNLNSTCTVEDGVYNKFYLIDKMGIKVLEYYAPESMEDCLAKDINRQKAIKAIAALQHILKEAD